MPFGTDDATAVDVWVRPVNDSGLATVGEVLDDAGVIRPPVSTIVVRMRYRLDVVLESRFRDERGRTYRVHEVREVPRRRFLDVVCSTYDTLMRPEGDPAFVAPSGWFLQFRRGNVVNELTVREARANGPQVRFEVTIPSGGFQVASGQTQWIAGTSFQGQQIAVTAADRTAYRLSGFYVTPLAARLVANNQFDAGLAFPTHDGGLFVAVPSGFASPTLAPGNVIHIEPGA